MGRDRARKPRKIEGTAGLKADTIAHLDSLPQLERINDRPVPDLGAKVLLICLDAAVMMLRHDLRKCGREGFYQTAREKGLSRVQARKLEGVFVLMDQINLSSESDA